MGYYVNPSAESFAAIARSKTYVDKTGLIEYMNAVAARRLMYVSILPMRPDRWVSWLMLLPGIAVPISWQIL